MTPLDGGCLCGGVRYRLEAAPVAASICHCRSCRRGAGAESVGWLTVVRSAFRLTTGGPALYESSPGIRRGFCASCGATLTFDDGGDSIDVTIASLDDPEAVRPDCEIRLEDRVSWNALDHDLPHFQHRRERG